MSEQTFQKLDAPKTQFGRLTLVGPVKGGFAVVCSCGRDLIVKQLVDSPDDTSDWQRCRRCNKKAKKIREFLTPVRRKRIANWIARLREGKTIETDKEFQRILRRTTGVDLEQWNDMVEAAQIETLKGALKEKIT
jgi:hypothetical protein